MAKAKGRNLKVNMKDVESGSVLIPEGDYLVEVAAVEVAESESSGKEYLKWKLEIITDGPVKGQCLFHNTSLQPQALFNLKGVLISLGMPVPDKVLELDLDDIEGRQMGVTCEHEVYENKKKARVTETFPWDGDSEDGDDDDSVDPSTLDLDELLEFAAEHGIEIPVKAKKNKTKVLALVEAGMIEPDEDVDDEPESDGLDDLDLKGLKTYAKKNDIDLTELTAKELKNEDKIREIIRDAQATGGEEDDNGPDEADEPEDDLDELDLKGLKKYAKDNEIDLSELSAKDAKNEDKVREAIREAASTDDESEDEAPDFDGMSLKELIAFAKENDIAISKKIIKDEKKVRAAVVEEYTPEEDEVDLEAMDLGELLAYAAENDIAISKKIKDNVKKIRAYIVSEMEEE